METLYPGLTRPVLCGYRFYNQDLSTGSLLIEIGGHANTLAEALRAGEYAARALADLFGAGKGARRCGRGIDPKIAKKGRSAQKHGSALHFGPSDAV